MENHIRLAERQGLLKGLSLSPVQVFALRLLIYSDAKKDQAAQVEAAKVALIASGSRSVQSLYPAWFGEGESDQPQYVDEADQSGALPDAANYESVRWLSPKDGEDFQELLRLQEELMKDSVTVGGGGGAWDDETNEGGGWT